MRLTFAELSLIKYNNDSWVASSYNQGYQTGDWRVYV